MKQLWHRLNAHPVAHAVWEMAAMRGLFAWLMWRMLPARIPFTAQPVPNGLAHFFDFTFLTDTAVYEPLRWGMLAALVCYVAGLLPVVSLGYATAMLIAVGTLENSQGAIGHHLQLVCLVAGGQWLVYAGGARRRLGSTHAALDIQQTAVQAAKVVIVAGYVASGCVKLIASGGLWVWQLPDIALQLVKTHANVYYDTLWPQAVWSAETLPHLIVTHPNLTRLAFTPGLVLELFAFFALIGRKAGFAIGAGLLLMHLLIRLVMQLSFSAHEWLLVIFFLNPPFLLHWLVGWVADKRRRTQAV